jgi:hypothetical protein
VPDFAKRFREEMASATMYYVAVRLMPWESFVLMGQRAPRPTEHSVGCLMVFDDEPMARDWADGGEVLHLLVHRKPEEARQ